MATTITANGINFPDGSASAPSIGGTDTNTGLFTGSDIVGFATGGLERIRIDASGRVIIGDDHTNNAFAGGDSLIIGNEDNGTRSGITLVSASNTDGGLYFSHGSSNTTQGQVVYNHANNYMAFYVNGSNRALNILGGSNGYITMGRNDALASARLSLQCSAGDPGISIQTNTSGGTVDLIKAYNSAGPNVASICVNPDSTPDLLFKLHDGSNTVERLRITSAGNVGIGTTSPGRALHVTVADAPSAKFGGGTHFIELGQLASGSSAGLNIVGGSNMLFRMGGTEAMRIDPSGRLLIGTTSNTSPIGWGNNLQVAGTSAVAGVSIRRDSADTGGALLVFGKSRGSLNGNTVVQSGDQIGGMYFAGGDGTDVNSIAAQLSVEVDGTPGSNDMPGRILFKTTADGASSPTERLRIDSGGKVFIGTTTSHAGKFIVKDTDNSGNQIWVIGRANGNTGSISFRNEGDTAYTGRIQASTANGMEFNSAGSTRASLDTSGNFIINDGNLKILTAGHGIDFSVTGNGGGTADTELMSDYEEGAWSPSISYGTSNSGLSVTESAGLYVKVGRFIHLSAMISWNEGSASGPVRITGLPYVTKNNNNTRLGGHAIYLDGFSGLSGSNIFLYATGNTSTASMYFVSGDNDSHLGPSDSAVTHSVTSSGNTTRFVINYYTDS